mmetsp:Transcript_299/g.618  ORF Transcript_299/g.618 Transcript_299/m.618 type:complete len:190 (-) Transcript_299:29-598(-)
MSRWRHCLERCAWSVLGRRRQRCAAPRCCASPQQALTSTPPAANSMGCPQPCCPHLRLPHRTRPSLHVRRIYMFTSPLQVEAVLGSFMQLREESNINMGEAVMEGVFDFNDDDDDLQIGFGGGAEEKTKEGGKAKAGGKGKPKAGSKAKPRAKPKAKAAGTKGKGKGGAPKGASKAKQIGKKSTGVKKK